MKKTGLLGTNKVGILSKVVLGAAIIILLGVIVNLFFGWPIREVRLSHLVSLIGILVFVAVVEFFILRLPDVSRKLKWVIFICLAIFAIITECFVAHALMGHGSAWDVSVVDSIARYYIEHGTTKISPPAWGTDYLTIYPNNIFITMILVGWFNFTNWFGNTDFAFASQLLNSLAILVSVFILVFLAKKFYGFRAALVAFGFGYILIILSSYAPITYTDTIGMFFVMVIILLATLAYYSEKPGLRLMLAGLFGAFTILGYYIKPTAAIPAIAISLVFVVFNCHKVFTKNNLSVVGCALAGLIVGFVGFKIIFNTMPNFAKSSPAETEKYETTFWQPLAMGSFRGLAPFEECKSGSYCARYVDCNQGYFTTCLIRQDLTTRESRKDFALDLLVKSVSTNFPLGYGRFLIKKTVLMFSDGSFGIWGEGGALNKNIKFYNNTEIDFVIRSNMAFDGKNFANYKMMLRAMWFSVLLLVFAGLISLWFYRNLYQKPWILASVLTLLGVVAFLLIFESRARYLFMFVPIFILLAVGGMTIFREMFWQKMTKLKIASSKKKKSR